MKDSFSIVKMKNVAMRTCRDSHTVSITRHHRRIHAEGVSVCRTDP
jgi:hypothetical protein